MTTKLQIHKIIYDKDAQNKQNRALFLDRDGIINTKPPEHEYVASWSEFNLNKDVLELACLAYKKGYIIVVVTNQRGIGRGLFSLTDMNEISNNMAAVFRDHGAPISAVYFCPHDHEDNCNCRKPLPGLFHAAIDDLKIIASLSIAIGDSPTDIQAAQEAGIKSAYLVPSNPHTQHFPYIAFNPL